MQQMIEAFVAGNTSEATAIHLRLTPLFKALFITTNPIPIKAALNLQGWDVGALRPPLCEIEGTLKLELQTVLRELNLPRNELKPLAPLHGDVSD
jgi:4-hydroxy-tetrahydrodipicolinate synthase